MTQAHCRHRDAGRTPRVGTGAGPQVRVTLSDDLLRHLRQTAQQKHVPLRWLVAGLVCDTMKLESGEHQVYRAQCGGR
jgi:hypothetical protein